MTPTTTAVAKNHPRRGPLAVLRQANGVKNASENVRESLLASADRLETASAYIVLAGIVLEAILALSPLSLGLFKIGGFVADAAVALGIYGEMRFGHIVSDILRIRLAEAKERAANAERDTEILRADVSWRRLSQPKMLRISTTLRESGEPASVRFVVLVNDAESLNFAQQISVPFMVAGWKIGYRYEAYRHGIMTGIFLPDIRADWTDDMKLANGRVRAAFIAADLRFTNGWPMQPYMSTDSIGELTDPIAWVYVGPKRPPALEGDAAPSTEM